jgi:hypothetical protein
LPLLFIQPLYFEHLVVRQIFWLQEDGSSIFWCLAMALAFTQCTRLIYLPSALNTWARHENGKKILNYKRGVYNFLVVLIFFMWDLSFPLWQFDQLRLPKHQNELLNTAWEISCQSKIFLLSLVTSNHISWLLTFVILQTEDEVQYWAGETR